MTISTTESRKSYTGNGSTVAFSFPYKFLADGDLKIYVDNVLKTLTTDYTVSGAGSDSGGTVTFVTAPASLTSVVFYRDMAITQEVDYITGDAFPAETHEEALDRLTMIDQQQEDQIDRAVKLQLGDETSSMELPVKATRATKMLGFDANGDPVMSESTVDEIDAAANLASSSTVSYTNVATVAALKLLGSAISDNDSITVLGYYGEGDGGGGEFFWDATSVATANNGTIIQATSVTTGRWIRVHSGEVNVRWFGAKGDGSTLDTGAFANALATGKDVYIPKGDYVSHALVMSTTGQSMFGDGYSSNFIQSTSNSYIYVTGSHVNIENIRITGTAANGGILIKDGSKGLDIKDVYFYQGGQRVWLWACTNVRVLNCTFDNTSYGIIQQVGYASDNVLVDGCIASDMNADFVEANCANNPSKNWVITNNHYLGHSSYPTNVTEGRFVGITAVENVIISNNVVEKAAGDAAIHLEAALGDVIIDSNVFDNCLVSSQDGIIYMLSSSEATTVSNNIFKRSDSTLPNAMAFSNTSSFYADETIFIGNRVIGNGVTKNLGGVNTAFNGKAMLITNNVFENLSKAVNLYSSNSVKLSDNIVLDCDEGFHNVRLTAGSGSTYIDVIDNTFRNTTNNDIYTTTNLSGTSPPTYWNVTGNRISKKLTITDSGAGGVNNVSNCVVMNNVFEYGATYSISGLGYSTQWVNNIMLDSVAVNVPQMVLRDYANDAAAAVGNIPVLGLYRNGSVVMVRVV